MLTRNRLANISFFVCSCGELVVLAILAGILEGIITDAPDSNTRALSIVCAYSAGVWSESSLVHAGDEVVLTIQSFAQFHGSTTSNTGQEIRFLREHRTSLSGAFLPNHCPG